MFFICYLLVTPKTLFLVSTVVLKILSALCKQITSMTAISSKKPSSYLHYYTLKLKNRQVFLDLDMHILFILNVQDGQIRFTFGSKVNTPLLFNDNFNFIAIHLARSRLESKGYKV